MANPLFVSLLRLKNLSMRLLLGEDRREAHSPEAQRKIIESFPEPRDAVERSYFQYVCQKKRYASLTYRALCSVANLAALVPLVYFVAFKHRDDDSEVSGSSESASAVFLGQPHILDRLPNSLRDRYDEIDADLQYGMLMTKRERQLIRDIWARYPLSFLFVLKCAMKIMAYCDIIDKSGAKAIIATSEDSYTSSILTHYCRMRSVRHINIMHGEILYGLARTFFSFDECIVWDEYYKGLCLRMRAESAQFKVDIPEGLLYRGDSSNMVGATYYFQNQTREQMIEIKKALDHLGVSYRVRPHPIYTNMDNLNLVFGGETIEDFDDVPIEQSIMGSEMLIAKSSTVLFQGYINKKKVVIDDLSDPCSFSQARESGYIMANKCECDLLSEIIARVD